MNPTPAVMATRSTPVGYVDPQGDYTYGSGEYWKKRSLRKQLVIEARNADIRALEARLIELETELEELTKGKK